jgi:hypothetical protein
VRSEAHALKGAVIMISAELPLSIKTFPIIHPSTLTLTTIASLWETDFSLKSSSVKVIGTFAHSSHAVGPSSMITLIYLQ